MKIFEAETFEYNDKWCWRITIAFPAHREIQVGGFQTEQEARSDCMEYITKGGWMLGEDKR